MSSTTLVKPNASVLSSSTELLRVLVKFYEGIAESLAPLAPGRSPNLKAITVSAVSALRQQLGDAAGENGPRCALLAGGSSVLDGRQAIYAWDPTTTLVDDGVTVVKPASLTAGSPGAWRLMVPLGSYGTWASPIASASTIAPGPGRSVSITGTTTINNISTAGRRDGIELRLEFQSAACVLTHNAAVVSGTLPFFSSTGANFVSTAGAFVDLIYNARTGYWREINRSA